MMLMYNWCNACNKLKTWQLKKDLHEKELAELRTAAQVVVDMVDLVEDGVATSRSLVV